MKIDVSTIATVLQIVSMIAVLPYGAWKAWNKIDARLSEQDLRLIRIEGQFHRNGGTSLRDSIDRIDKEVAKLQGRFDQHVEDRNK